MIFIGCKIINKMSRHILSYSFLIVELSVGILFFSYGMNFFFSGLEREGRLEKELGKEMYYLDVYSLGSNGENIDSDVTYEDYINITKLTNAQVDFTAIYDMTVVSRGGNIQTKVVYSDMNMERNTFFYGLGSEQILHNQVDRIVSSLPIKTKKNGAVVHYNHEKKFYIAKELDYDLQDKMLFRGPLMEDLKIGDCFLLPLRDYQYLEDGSQCQKVMMIRFPKGDSIDAESQKICSYLQQQHGEGYRYELKNIMSEYQDTKESYLQVSKFIAQVSVLMLLVLIIGYRGVMAVFLERRKREFAICLAVGARRWQLIVEYAGEVALICFTGILIGLILGNVFVNHSINIAFPVRTQPITIVMCIGIALAIILSVLATFMRFLICEQPLCGMRNDIV